MKQLVVLLLTLLLVLVTFVFASADSPYVWFDEDFDDSFKLADCSPLGFEVWDRSVGHAKAVVHFDNEGRPIDIFDKTNGVDYLYSTTDPNNVISGHFSYSIHKRVTAYDVDGEPIGLTYRLTGAYWNIQVPGLGTLYHQSGQAVGLEVFDGVNWVTIDIIKQVGLTDTDKQMLCEYFAG